MWVSCLDIVSATALTNLLCCACQQFRIYDAEITADKINDAKNVALTFAGNSNVIKHQSFNHIWLTLCLTQLEPRASTLPNNQAETLLEADQVIWSRVAWQNDLVLCVSDSSRTQAFILWCASTVKRAGASSFLSSQVMPISNNSRGWSYPAWWS